MHRQPKRSLDDGARIFRSPAPLVIAIVALVGAACATDTPMTGRPPRDDDPLPANLNAAEILPTGDDAEVTDDGLVLIPDTGPGTRLYIRPPHPGLQRFDGMLILPTVLEYSQVSARWPSAEELEVLQRFEVDLENRIMERDIWPVVETRDANTMLVRASIFELAISEVGRRSRRSGASTVILNSTGGAVIGFEIFDGATGQPLLRYLERHRMPAGMYSGGDVGRERVDSMLREFADELAGVLNYQFRISREVEKDLIEERLP